MKKQNYTYSRQLIHPVTLLSVSDGSHENIATMSWVSAVSSDPPLMMVAVSPKRYSHDLMIQAGEFAILVLSNLQNELATLAGTKSGSKIQKWDLPQFKALRKDAKRIKAPIIRDCRAVMECQLIDRHTAGDHTLFIGKIVETEIDPDVQPLILFNRKYFNPGQFIAKYP